MIYEPVDNFPLTYNDLLLVYSQNEEQEPIYQYYLVYDDVETAQEDLETRQLLLAEGESLNFRVPYSEIFSKSEVLQQDNKIIITVDFPEDMPG